MPFYLLKLVQGVMVVSVSTSRMPVLESATSVICHKLCYEEEMRWLKASSIYGVTKATLRRRAYVKMNRFCKVRGIRQLKIMFKLELQQEIVITKLLASTLSGPAWNEIRKLALELAERDGIWHFIKYGDRNGWIGKTNLLKHEFHLNNI
jgi:hypothetical protein